MDAVTGIAIRISSYAWTVMYIHVLVFAINARVVELTGFKAYFTEAAKGHRLKDSLIYEKKVSSLLECAQLCLTENLLCKSINVEKEEQKNIRTKRSCQLNNGTSSPASQKLAIDSSFDYFEITKIQSKTSSYGISAHEKSCADLYMKGERKNGMYTIDPNGQGPFQVRCDMTTDGGGWTVFQRRLDGSVDFYRGWTNYQNGFGNLSGEFWLGLDHIHRLSASGQDVLRVDLGDFEGEISYAQYNRFAVANRTSKYMLTVAGYTGTAGDSLSTHNSCMFSTMDRDNDLDVGRSCALSFMGAWWYQMCHDSNLNGLYLSGVMNSYADGVIWQTWRGYSYSLKICEMKIRPSV